MTSPSEAFQLKEKIEDLRQKILGKHPAMPTLLREIHQCVKQYPEQVTLLEPDEIKVIINGLENQANIYLAAKAMKSASSPSKLANLKNKIKTMGEDAF